MKAWNPTITFSTCYSSTCISLRSHEFLFATVSVFNHKICEMETCSLVPGISCLFQRLGGFSLILSLFWVIHENRSLFFIILPNPCFWINSCSYLNSIHTFRRKIPFDCLFWQDKFPPTQFLISISHKGLNKPDQSFNGNLMFPCISPSKIEEQTFASPFLVKNTVEFWYGEHGKKKIW